jgi:predicted GNAT family acetyltransferase
LAAEVTDNPDRNRYEIREDGRLAGFSRYRDEDGVRVFMHTEIHSDFEGQGLGRVLAQEALDDVRRQGRRVVAECPFIAAYIRDHPEMQDLLEGASG